MSGKLIKCLEGAWNNKFISEMRIYIKHEWEEEDSWTLSKVYFTRLQCLIIKI